MFITYPNTVKSDTYSFMLNTDDYFDVKPINDYLKSKNIVYTKSKTYSKTKCIGWHVYKIKTNEPIKSFDENIKFVENLFNNYNYETIL